MRQKLRPHFCLSGQFDPNEITQRLEIQPSWVKEIGDPGPVDAIGPRLGAEWAWQPEDDDSDNVGDQFAYLAGSLSLKHEEVTELSKMFFGTFHVYNQVDKVNRNWFLSPQTLRLIADLQVNVECENVSLSQIEELLNDAN